MPQHKEEGCGGADPQQQRQDGGAVDGGHGMPCGGLLLIRLVSRSSLVWARCRPGTVRSRYKRRLIQLNLNKSGLHGLEWKTRDPYSLVNDSLITRTHCTTSTDGIHFDNWVVGYHLEKEQVTVNP